MEVKSSEIRSNLRCGYYGFFEYAYAYWARHLERSAATQTSDDCIQELIEAVGVFIELHWTEPHERTPTPRSILEILKIFKNVADFEKIACAVHVSRKQLITANNVSPTEQVLGLSHMLGRIREELESLGNSVHDLEIVQKKYGTNVFKCPRVNCTRFYNGFSTRQLRDNHVQRHERSYFCSFPSCLLATVGCATIKELQKHENEAHGTFDFDEEDDFPEEPVEKVSFSCDQCNAKFTRKYNLNIHMRSHNAPNQKQFACSSCGKEFARLGDRTRHQSTFHSAPKSFTCGGKLKNGNDWGCGQVFNRADTLTRHYKSEKGRNCKLPLEEEEASESSASTPRVH
jgi:uncharacterized Zn-finger protein